MYTGRVKRRLGIPVGATSRGRAQHRQRSTGHIRTQADGRKDSTESIGMDGEPRVIIPPAVANHTTPPHDSPPAASVSLCRLREEAGRKSFHHIPIIN